MIRFVPYLLKTLWRHRSRTILTVSGSTVALFVFCFVGAVQEGMNDLTNRQEAKQSLITFQANKFCPATSHLPQDYDRKIRDIEGVRDVVPIQVYTNNCRATLDAIVFYGLPAEKVRTVRDFQLLGGSWEAFEGEQKAAIVGQAVATRGDRNLNVGDSFSIGGLTVNVAGIFESGNPAEENYIYTHLDFLQRNKDQNLVGTVTQFEVLLADGADSTTASDSIDNLLRSGPVETDTRPKGVFQAHSLGDLMQLIALAHYLGYACVGLVLVLVSTTTVMAVQDRIKEHAVLRTIGFSGVRIFALVLGESLFLSVAGGLLGVTMAMAALWLFPLAVYTEAVTVAFTPSLRLAAMGLVVSLATGLVAGLAPAQQAARTEIVPALRHA